MQRFCAKRIGCYSSSIRSRVLVYARETTVLKLKRGQSEAARVGEAWKCGCCPRSVLSHRTCLVSSLRVCPHTPVLPFRSRRDRPPASQAAKGHPSLFLSLKYSPRLLKYTAYKYCCFQRKQKDDGAEGSTSSRRSWRECFSDGISQTACMHWPRALYLFPCHPTGLRFPCLSDCYQTAGVGRS